jgi:hypothetical protein
LGGFQDHRVFGVGHGPVPFLKAVTAARMRGGRLTFTW